MNNFLTNLRAHWKSTVNGFLGLFITVGLALQLLNSPLISTKVNLGITLGLAVARAIIGYIQKDAGTVVADVAGKGPVPVASHEVPN